MFGALRVLGGLCWGLLIDTSAAPRWQQQFTGFISPAAEGEGEGERDDGVRTERVPAVLLLQVGGFHLSVVTDVTTTVLHTGGL